MVTVISILMRMYCIFIVWISHMNDIHKIISTIEIDHVKLHVSLCFSVFIVTNHIALFSYVVAR